MTTVVQIALIILAMTFILHCMENMNSFCFCAGDVIVKPHYNHIATDDFSFKMFIAP